MQYFYRKTAYTSLINRLTATGESRSHLTSCVIAKLIANNLPLGPSMEDSQFESVKNMAEEQVDRFLAYLPLEGMVISNKVTDFYNQRVSTAYPAITSELTSLEDDDYWLWMHGGTKDVSISDNNLLATKKAHKLYNELALLQMEFNKNASI